MEGYSAVTPNLAQTAALNVPANSSNGEFGKDTPNRPFSEIFQRGDQGKMLKKVGRLHGPGKQLGANCATY